jgi:hypothetical protein
MRISATMSRPPLPALVVIGSFLAVSLSFGSPAYACSCVEPDLASLAPEAALAVIGEQVGRTDLSGLNEAVLEIEVHGVFQGDVGEGDIVEMHTAQQSSTCGIDMANQGVVGILAWDGGDGSLDVNSCSSLWSSEQLVDFYGFDAVTDGTEPPFEPAEAASDVTDASVLVAEQPGTRVPGASSGSGSNWWVVVLAGGAGLALLGAGLVPARAPQRPSPEE